MPPSGRRAGQDSAGSGIFGNLRGLKGHLVARLSDDQKEEKEKEIRARKGEHARDERRSEHIRDSRQDRPYNKAHLPPKSPQHARQRDIAKITKGTERSSSDRVARVETPSKLAASEDAATPTKRKRQNVEDTEREQPKKRRTTPDREQPKKCSTILDREQPSKRSITADREQPKERSATVDREQRKERSTTADRGPPKEPRSMRRKATPINATELEKKVDARTTVHSKPEKSDPPSMRKESRDPQTVDTATKPEMVSTETTHQAEQQGKVERREEGAMKTPRKLIVDAPIPYKYMYRADRSRVEGSRVRIQTRESLENTPEELAKSSATISQVAIAIAEETSDKLPGAATDNVAKVASSHPSPSSSKGPPTDQKRSIADVEEPEQQAAKKPRRDPGPVRMLPVSREELMARDKSAYTFAPTVPNSISKPPVYAAYDDDSVPVLVSAAIYHRQGGNLLNHPSLELKVQAILLLERGFDAQDLGCLKISRKGPTKIINDCDLYLREGKLHVATERGLLLASQYLQLAGIPESTKVRFSGVKPAWTHKFLEGRQLRRITKTTDDDEPLEVVSYPALPPGHIGLKLGYVVEMYGTSGEGKNILGYGRNLKTRQVGWFNHENTVALNANYGDDQGIDSVLDKKDPDYKWDGCLWSPEQRDVLAAAVQIAASTPVVAKAPASQPDPPIEKEAAIAAEEEPKVLPGVLHDTVAAEEPAPAVEQETAPSPPAQEDLFPASPPRASPPQLSAKERGVEDDVDWDDDPL
jgi:hypothetical protein